MRFLLFFVLIPLVVHLCSGDSSSSEEDGRVIYASRNTGRGRQTGGNGGENRNWNQRHGGNRGNNAGGRGTQTGNNVGGGQGGTGDRRPNEVDETDRRGAGTGTADRTGGGAGTAGRGGSGTNNRRGPGSGTANQGGEGARPQTERGRLGGNGDVEASQRRTGTGSPKRRGRGRGTGSRGGSMIGSTDQRKTHPGTARRGGNAGGRRRGGKTGTADREKSDTRPTGSKQGVDSQQGGRGRGGETIDLGGEDVEPTEQPEAPNESEQIEEPEGDMEEKGNTELGVNRNVKPCELECAPVDNPRRRVCGSDGRTYASFCYLKAARCRRKRLTFAKRGPCPVGNNGDIDRDTTPARPATASVTHSPSVGVLTDPTRAGGTTGLGSTSDMGSTDLTIELGAGTSGTTPPFVVTCPSSCPLVRNLVCATDGVTYQSSCVLQLVACVRNDPTLVVASLGQCPTTAPFTLTGSVGII